MAEILASALVSTVLENLNSTALRKIGLAWGLEGELERFNSTLTTVQLVLQDAEKKQRKSEALQNWLMKLKDAAFDAENVLDLIPIEDFRRRRGTRYHLLSYFSRRNPLVCRYKIARKLKIIRERLDAIAEERIKFHLTEGVLGVLDNSVGGTVESRETSSLVYEPGIVGRKEEKEMIIETLLGTTLDDELSVYAICGMGGLGKTTLAKLVYNDARTEKHFNLRIWVCVSDDFSIQRVLKEIIKSLDGGRCEISGLDPLQRYLQEKLRGKRFLLVLDDVWNENNMLWDELKEVLRCGSHGSVLTVTTRIEKVADMMATIPIHHLEYLSEADSWSLFRQKAFATREDEESLIEIGKAIVMKCGGVPLAVKALGSLMRTKSSEREWLAIKESEIWLLSKDENGILPVLRLSYDNLPLHVRHCFAYCCIFPKDYQMEEDQLIQLWMANGFLPSEGQPDLYLTGHNVFEELVRSSLFQDVSGRTCKMHDLVHDLAQSVMKKETYIMEHGKSPEIPQKLLHLSLDLNIYKENKVKLRLIEPNLLRSLVTCIPSEEEDLSSFLSKQRYLRVLDLQQQEWRRAQPTDKLMNLISKLQHLRYLAMSCVNRERLPESLTHLHCLQTLRLIRTGSLLKLPKGLKHMKNLWFLDIENHDSLLCMPPGVGELTCLQGLSIFIVGQDSSTEIRQLKELNIGGKLSIRGLENVRNLEDARSANLMGKKNLTSLSLSWMKDNKENSVENFEEVLEGLQPHQNLEELSISSYQGSRFPNWITSACKNLTQIFLSYCHKCEHLPPLGKLSSLLRLQLREMDSINHLGADWYGNGGTSFSALTHLVIDELPNLEEWPLPDSGESFPCLRYLRIKRCPKLNGLPSLSALRELKIKRCPKLNGLPSLPALRELEINDGNVALLRSNALDTIYNLRKLSLYGCRNLEFLPEGLKHLKFLEDLELGDLDNLTSFPAAILQDLSSLRTLQIGNCKRLNPLTGPLQRESPLEILWIDWCPEFKYFPESMQQFTSLRCLVIWNCEEIRYLPNWLDRLQSLSTMNLDDVKYLNSLPDAFRNLKSLRELEITGCDPQLEKRCKKAEGEDWPKISHVPKIVINDITIQRCDLLLPAGISDCIYLFISSNPSPQLKCI